VQYDADVETAISTARKWFAYSAAAALGPPDRSQVVVFDIDETALCNIKVGVSVCTLVILIRRIGLPARSQVVVFQIGETALCNITENSTLDTTILLITLIRHLGPPDRSQVTVSNMQETTMCCKKVGVVCALDNDLSEKSGCAPAWCPHFGVFTIWQLRR